MDPTCQSYSLQFISIWQKAFLVAFRSGRLDSWTRAEEIVTMPVTSNCFRLEDLQSILFVPASTQHPCC